MFGSTNPFGQSSTSSPFGSQSVFGQNNNASNNPFAPKPFGSTSPFGQQTGGSIFGSNSTGVFGATQASSPLGSTTAFGASSTPAFGASSTPAFGASPTPAFGASSSTFGGSSVFGQKPAFGGFGSTPTQSSPFGFQASQPAFGSSVFGSSTAFGAPSQPAFGASSTTPAFGTSSTPAFGATSSPAFGATNTPAFGSTASPGFGASSSLFGASSTPAFGASSTPAFGASSTPAFGASSTPAFGASSTPSFSFGPSPAFGQSASAFGAQATTPTFGSTTFGQQQAFGGQRGGSRVAPYTPTTETDVAAGAQAGKLESISAMPVYKDKSHEELRWEDYQLGDKGGPNPAGQSQTTGAVGFGTSTTPSNPFAASSPFGQTSSSPFSTPVASNPFSTPSSANPFAAKSQPFGTPGFGTSTTTAFNSSPFGASSTTNVFGATSSTSPSLFGSSTPAFGASSSTSLFGASSTSAFGSSPSIFGSASAQASSPAFGAGFGNTQSSPLFQSNAALLGQTSAFGQTNSAFGQTTSPFGQTSSPFGQTSIFNTPSTGFGGNLFSNVPSLTSNPIGFGQTTSSLSTPFQSAQPTQTTSLGFSNLGQTQIGTSAFGGTSNLFGQNAFGQSPATQSVVVPQPAQIANPFGTLPAMPQISIGRTGASPSIQYGISSMPVVDKPAPVRLSPLLTCRHLSQRRLRLPARKYHPQNEGPKVPFFENDEETPSTPKADALFVPRENPRALVIQPMEHRPLRGRTERVSPLKEKDASGNNEGKASDEARSNGHVSEENGISNGHVPERADPVKSDPKTNGIHNDTSTVGGDSHKNLAGRGAGEAATVHEHGSGIESLLPKLHSPDYYTQPQLQELAAKERAEPGFCSRVKDFVVGRRGYGSIKFLGETDVRGLDLEAIVQFNNKEVIVYLDEREKPPVGQGLNKPAEVILLNIKCIDKKTGRPIIDGPNVERYEVMLKKKAAEQGAEFVRYNPLEGEWIFRVSHFSTYKLGDEDCNSWDKDVD
uniref:Nucleoporin autopeptidase n=1 Tax=Kalanchoe fedtschenkoi TaxID=63787 RepID=A0A7N0U2J8_KALFE